MPESPEARALQARLAARLAALDAAGLRRTLRVVRPISPIEAEVDGSRAWVFCSNDYLGLATELEGAWRGGGAGAGASRLISGNRPAHMALEAALEERFGAPATLFPSGFAANLALLSLLPEASDVVASDALNHASIIDGLRLSRARRVVYPHADPGALPADATMVVTESVFSMDGDTAPLERFPTEHLTFVVDEAHAVGAMGPDGRGVCASRGLSPDVLVGTLGKAYGAAGAFVIGPPELKPLLVSLGRAFVYTTGMPEPVARAALAGLHAATDARREALARNVARLRSGLAQVGVAALGDTHIVPVRTGRDTMAVAARLLERGIFAPGVRWPTVARGEERVRLTVSAAHTDEAIDRCVEAVGQVVAGRS